MTDNARGRNWTIAERVEAWEWAAPKPVPLFAQASQAAPEAQTSHMPFDLDAHWRRGGFRGSLFAPSEEVAQAFLDRLIANDLVVVPSVTRRGVPIDSSQLLRTFARYNGFSLETLREKLGYDSVSFYELVEHFCHSGLIFRHPCRPHTGRADIYYFCDTGVLHRLFNPKWEQSGRGGKNFARSWEGFVVRTISQRYGVGADVFVWREAHQHEIDLVLQWPSGECWAIEIGLGENKRPSEGFKIGVRKLGATELTIIHRGIIDKIDGSDRMTLEELLTVKP